MDFPTLSEVEAAAQNAIANNPLAAIATAAGIGAAAGTITTAAISSSSSSSRKRRKGRKRDRKFISKQKWERAYVKKHGSRGRKRYKTKKSRRMRRRKGMHYTKKGQPYIILASGKARFVKKRGRR